ncbi:class I SAM-dependent methyltransferase [Azospirillum doebereinerae]
MDLRSALLPLAGKNYYVGFDTSSLQPEILGWGSEDPVFSEVIEKLRPTSIIEVGSWYGGSAIHMANLLKSFGIEATICSVDTWLGSIEHLSENLLPLLKIRHATPTIYERFLTNVISSKNQDIIIPFRQTSTVAAKYFAAKGVSVDLIYIDAGHEEDDVYNDVINYWKILRPGGIMLGDDCSTAFPGVVAAVRRFIKEQNVLPVQRGVKWYIEKPSL